MTPDKAVYFAPIDDCDGLQFKDREHAYDFWLDHPDTLILEIWLAEGRFTILNQDFEDMAEESRVDFALTRSHEQSFARPSGY